MAGRLRFQQGVPRRLLVRIQRAALSTTTSSTDRKPKKVVETWAWLTGKTPLPPLWSLGFQQSRYSYYPESEVGGLPADCAVSAFRPT